MKAKKNREQVRLKIGYRVNPEEEVYMRKIFYTWLMTERNLP